MAEIKRKTPFVSSIKVKGIHLLPPVITHKRRTELQGYKCQAIKLENRLKNCKELKKNLDDLLNMQPLTDRPYSQISFQSDGHVEALGITEKTNNNLPSKTSRKIRLSRDIIDVTQYDSHGIKVIYNEPIHSIINEDRLNRNDVTVDINTPIKLTKTHYPCGQSVNPIINQNSSNIDTSDLNSTILSIFNEDCKTSSNNSPENIDTKIICPSLEKSPKPRLIRSNSYTLETPSPILLAHLEKTGCNKQNDAKHLESIKNLSISRNWSSLENNYVPYESSEFSSINTVCNNDINSNNKNIKSSTPIGGNEQDNIEQSTSPVIKVIQTDISVQNITVNANNEILNDASDENYDASDSQLLQVLKTLPEVYAKQIIDLIQSQKVEKQEQSLISHDIRASEVNEQVPKKDNFQNIVNANDRTNNKNAESHTSIINTDFKNECKNSLHEGLSLLECGNLEGSNTSLSPSQSIYYSLTSCSTLRPMSNASVQLIDFECDAISDEKFNSPSKADITEYYVNEEIRKGINVSRELFPVMDLSASNSIKQEWAASIIGAHVKGYLTRRLLRTERVQSLIETIKDALMCALELHNTENIDESDVELHRRLMNQVSAACFSFHDIFFSLTIQEQMLIIATDRQRKLEKAKRPASAPNSNGSKSSSRSTPSQRMASYSRSLTKV